MIKDFIKVLLVVLAATLIRKFLGLYNYQAGIDDSNIYFVYVRNLFEGNGFVYNSDGPHVEGFTSFLWTILLTIIYSLRFLPFETSVLVVCFIITTCTVFLYFRYFKKYYSEPHAWLLVFYIVLTPGFIDWNVFTLMDICLWIFAGSWATLLLLSGEKKRVFVILTLLLPFIRPEGIAVSLILYFLKLAKDYASHRSIQKAWRNNAYFLIGIVTSIALLTTFRLLYFGYPFPNTFYAKVSLSVMANIKQAFFYFYDAVRHTSIVPFLLLIISIVGILLRRYFVYWKTNVNVLALLTLILFFVAYPFLTGGDHFKYSRFFQPVFPMIGLLFLILYHHRINLGKPAALALLIFGFILLNLNSTDKSSFREGWLRATKSYFKELSPDLVSPSQLQSEFNIAVYGKRLAAHMNEVLSASDSLPSFGVVAAGGIGYVYEGKTIDLMGLNNPEMAHANRVKSQGVKNHGSFDKTVFYKQDVDIFLSWPDPLTAKTEQNDSTAVSFLSTLKDPQYFINRVCNNIFNDSAFNQIYTFSKISNGVKHFYGFIKYDSFVKKNPELRVQKLN